MASSSNPMAGAMAQRMIQALAARGQSGGSASPMTAQPSPGAGGGPGGDPSQGQQQPDMTSKVSSELSDVQGADPAAIRGLLLQLKQQLVALIPHTAFRIPGITKHISKMVDSCNAAVEEANKALQTTQAVGNTPIGMSAVQPAAGTAGPGV